MTIAWADEAVHVRAPGKINLFMRVGAVQSDGYHDVVTPNSSSGQARTSS